MQRFIIYAICVLLSSSVVCHAQQYDYRYWFDHAVSEALSGTLTSAQSTLKMDVDNLSGGIHYLHFQVADTAGCWSATQSSMFLKADVAENRKYTARYWFDNEEAIPCEATNGVQMLDVSTLKPGIHYLHYQAGTTDGTYSAIASSMFLKADASKDGNFKARYWFDNGEAVDTVVIDGVMQMDVSKLKPGIHYLHYQAGTTDGTYSVTASSMFLKADASKDGNFKARYWFDNEEAIQCDATSGVQQLDVSALKPGIHYLHYQAGTTDGTYSATASSMFLKADAGRDGNFKARYWFDNGEAVDTVVIDGVMQVDVSKLKPGIHFLHYQIGTNDGVYSAIKTAMFKKESSGGLMRLDYWVNDDTENTRMKFEQRKDTLLALKTSLEVSPYPIKPSSFHFEVADNKQYIYSKNTLHARIHDLPGTFAEDSATYIDMQSRREVTDFVALTRGVLRTDATPAADSIRWYRLDAYKGHVLQFTVSQPCVVQVFTQEGENIFNEAGTVVKDSFDCNTMLDGIHYLALHSVKGTAPETSILYESDYALNYRVQYYVDGKLYATDSIAERQPIVPPTAPTKEGHTFIGWDGLPDVMPAEDVVVTAKYSLNSVQTDEQGVRYELNAVSNTFEAKGTTDELVVDIVLPATIYDVPVSGIAAEAFKDAEIQTLVIPATIQEVGDDAFVGCTELRWVDWQAQAQARAECFDAPEVHGNMLLFCYGEEAQDYAGNVVVNGKAKEIVLIDARPYASPYDYEAENISFTKTFTKETMIGTGAGWEGIVVPFDVERIVFGDKVIAPFGASGQYSDIPCWLAQMKDENFVMTDAIKADEAYIMAVPNSEAYDDDYNVEGDVRYEATNVRLKATSQAATTPAGGLGLVGTYELVEAAANVFTLNDEEYWKTYDGMMAPGSVFVQGLRDVRPFEAYVRSTKALHMACLKIGNVLPTNIAGIQNGGADAEAWYTLQGKRLNTKPVQTGFYLHGGKLEFVRQR